MKTWDRFRSHPGAITGLILISFICLFSFIGPFLNDYNFWQQNIDQSNQSMMNDHYFGTDHLGRDLWQRTWYGAKVSLFIAFLATLFDVLLGVTIGSLSGYFGGRIDLFIQRGMEILYSIPSLIIIILMLIWLEPGILPIAIALSITGWIPMARIVRAQILKLKNEEFILAARSLGASHLRILWKHLYPNMIGPLIVSITFTIPSAIFFEAFLSFIGLGLRPPEASLGILVSDGYQFLALYPYQLFWPALVLCLMILAFHLLGDGIRDVFDVKYSRKSL